MNQPADNRTEQPTGQNSGKPDEQGRAGEGPRAQLRAVVSCLPMIPDDLFGEIFPKGQDPVDSAIAVIAARCEGYNVPLGNRIGEIEIDELSCSKRLLEAIRRTGVAGDGADASRLFDESFPASLTGKSDKEVRAGVGSVRAVIAEWKRQEAMPKRYKCDIADADNNIDALIRTRIEPYLPLANVYRRNKALSRVVAKEAVRPADGSVTEGLVLSGLSIDQHDIFTLATEVSSVIDFARERTLKSGAVVMKPCNPPKDLMAQTLRLGDWPNVPVLRGVTAGPFLRPNGSICHAPGYDPSTGWMLDYTGDPLTISHEPTKSDAEFSANILFDIVADFEWASDSQKAGWLGYLLTLLARPAINGPVPAFVFTSSLKGSGKTLLATIANLIAFGVEPSAYTAPGGREPGVELKKALFAFAMSGSPTILFDNLPSGSAVGWAELDAAITSGAVTDRIMATHTTKESPWVATVSLTGNNLCSSADFARRSIWAALEPTTDNPAGRPPTDFRIPDLRGHVREQRGQFLSDALTILKWGFANGQTYPAGMKNFGTFESWQALVRWPIYHLTGIDIVANTEVAGVMDEEASEIATLFAGLSDYCQWRIGSGRPDWFSIGELHTDLSAFGNETSWPELRELIDPALNLPAFMSSAGKIMTKYRNRVLDGVKLHAKKVDRRHLWKVAQK